MDESYLALILKSAQLDAQIIEIAYEHSDDMGRDATIASMNAFRSVLKAKSGLIFVPSISIEYRIYIVELLQRTPENIRNKVFPVVLWGSNRKEEKMTPDQKRFQKIFLGLKQKYNNKQLLTLEEIGDELMEDEMTVQMLIDCGELQNTSVRAVAQWICDYTEEEE